VGEEIEEEELRNAVPCRKNGPIHVNSSNSYLPSRLRRWKEKENILTHGSLTKHKRLSSTALVDKMVMPARLGFLQQLRSSDAGG